MGGSTQAIEAIKQGKLTGTSYQQPDEEGRSGIRLAVKTLDGEKLEKRYPIPCPPITKEMRRSLKGSSDDWGFYFRPISPFNIAVCSPMRGAGICDVGRWPSMRIGQRGDQLAPLPRVRRWVMLRTFSASCCRSWGQSKTSPAPDVGRFQDGEPSCGGARVDGLR